MSKVLLRYIVSIVSICTLISVAVGFSVHTVVSPYDYIFLFSSFLFLGLIAFQFNKVQKEHSIFIIFFSYIILQFIIEVIIFGVSRSPYGNPMAPEYVRGMLLFVHLPFWSLVLRDCPIHHKTAGGVTTAVMLIITFSSLRSLLPFMADRISAFSIGAALSGSMNLAPAYIICTHIVSSLYQLSFAFFVYAFMNFVYYKSIRTAFIPFEK